MAPATLRGPGGEVLPMITGKPEPEPEIEVADAEIAVVDEDVAAASGEEKNRSTAPS